LFFLDFVFHFLVLKQNSGAKKSRKMRTAPRVLQACVQQHPSGFSIIRLNTITVCAFFSIQLFQKPMPSIL
jgi:hypothetical protein